jgi:hypothetical protein
VAASAALKRPAKGRRGSRPSRQTAA